MSSNSSIESVIAREGFYLFTGSGCSMQPLIREEIDTVEVTPVSAPPEPGAVVLFRDGDRYVLHRMIRRNGELLELRGDNNCACETVAADRIIGIMTGIWRGDRKVSLTSPWYRLYTAICLHFPRFFRLVKSAFWR